jgi:hypothetical protein
MGVIEVGKYGNIFLKQKIVFSVLAFFFGDFENLKPIFFCQFWFSIKNENLFSLKCDVVFNKIWGWGR